MPRGIPNTGRKVRRKKKQVELVPTEVNCSNCSCYHAIEHDVGVCKAAPPTATGHPTTYADDWCGSHRWQY